MRAVARRPLTTGAGVALAATMGLTVMAMGAQAGVTGSASGFAAGATGGAGGQTVTASTGTQIHAAICGRASTSTPLTIEVEGTVTVGNTAAASGSCSTAAGVIELKGISNISIVGVGSGATFDQIGIHIRDSSNIVIQNVTVKNVKKSGSPTSNGGDAIGMESTVRNVWVDHVTLEASGGESEGYDGLFDMKGDVEDVTLSYAILRNSGRGGLIGSSETDTGNTNITFHHNLYQNIDSRAPLLRGGLAHIYNNHYVNLNESGINSRAGARAKVENNYFEDSKDVLGTFYTSSAGTWQTAGNILDNVTWSSKGSAYNPAGPSMASTGTASIPYSYELDDASCVPAIVAATAGAGKGLKVSDGSCTPQTPAPSPTATATATPTPAVSATPTATSTSTATSTPTSTAGTPTGTNLSTGAGADGSSKASGTSYGKAIDGSLSTYWSPNGTTGSISVKWGTATTVSTIDIRTASGGGTITGWRVLNGDSGAVLASGTGAPGTVSFSPTSLRKITFTITSASGTPRIAEFGTYAE
ncbi:polysaccharide lyase family 1 protein [Kineococcus glutinatus]|uniref:Polysaccharide lyase family 1 protein n=2 Tax=Kineococcus glutinatus TaxID=1070872 RepID=A0ABP9I5R6_9ACTN